MSGSKSRSKGQRGEREAADLLSRLLGFKWRRSQQVKGTQISPDIEPVDFADREDTRIWAEIKRDESTISKKIYQVMETAEEESGEKIPFLMSRRNREDWIVCIKMDHLIDFCEEIVRMRDK